MKKLALAVLAVAVNLGLVAQNVSVSEPEFLHGYIHLTSDSTFVSMPKEAGAFKKHESKFSRIAKIGSAAAGVAGAVGGVVTASAGSVGTAIGGLRTMGAASSVGSAAGSLGYLTGFEGMDIVFTGKSSPYAVTSGNDIRIIYRNESNEIDPLEIMRVVKFKEGKKDRKIRWMNMSSGLLGGEEASSNGYLAFTAKKYGESSYLITIPAEQLQKGEYGIIVGCAELSTAIPVATFSVQ